MPLNRPPLMSQGQANDFYSYTAIGTGLMFLAGGLAAGPAALALGLCGAGAVANNRRESGRNGYNPKMAFQSPNTEPPGGLSNPNWPPEAYEALAEREDELGKRFGMNAVYCYRSMILEGYKIKEGYDILYPFLQALRDQWHWDKGQIQSGNLTAKQILDYATGRRVASPELQQYFHPDYFSDFYRGVVKHPNCDASRAEQELSIISVWIYILGLAPISDMPVRRVKVWWDRTESTGRHPLYFVADWDWFALGTYEEIYERYNFVVQKCMVERNGMPQHLADEADDLWHYRVEPHRGDEPPGHPGGVLISSVLFGRTKSFPATEEDMRGMP